MNLWLWNVLAQVNIQCRDSVKTVMGFDVYKKNRKLLKDDFIS